MAALSYHTLESPAEGSYKEKGSRFIAFAFPVRSEPDILRHLDALRRQYFDARHHCYAWMLGPDKDRYRAVDDGEPGHSAGDPILGQIRSHNLTDVLIVVVRYFGGIKLGVGGLIAAYREAAAAALKNGKIVKRDVTRELVLKYPYDKTPEVMRMVKDFALDVLKQEYNDDCVVRVRVTLRNKPALFEKIKLINIPAPAIIISAADDDKPV